MSDRRPLEIDTPDNVKRLWGDIAKAHTVAFDVAAMADAVQQRIVNPPVAVITPAERKVLSMPKHRVNPFSWIVTAVACLAGIVLVATGGPSWIQGLLVRNEASVEYVTMRGEQLGVKLPDGSHVTLAPDSRISYRREVGGARVVTLVGKAYFNVPHVTREPFLVLAGGFETRVLGTAFSVRAYGDDRVTQVAVAEGKVAFMERGDSAGNAPELVLLPGNIASAEHGKTPQLVYDARVTEVFGWMQGQLVFDETPVRDVVRELERMYSVSIRVDLRLMDRPFTMTFQKASFDEVLEVLATAVGAEAKWDGNTVVLAPREL